MCGLVCCLGCISAFVCVGVSNVFTCVSECLCVSASALKCCVVSSCAYSCVRLLWGVLERFDLTGTCSGSSEGASPLPSLGRISSHPLGQVLPSHSSPATFQSPIAQEAQDLAQYHSCVVELSAWMLCTPYEGHLCRVGGHSKTSERPILGSVSCHVMIPTLQSSLITVILFQAHSVLGH